MELRCRRAGVLGVACSSPCSRAPRQAYNYFICYTVNLFKLMNRRLSWLPWQRHVASATAVMQSLSSVIRGHVNEGAEREGERV